MTLRLRLTLLYTLLFGACGALLLGISSWIVHRQVNRTLPPGYAEQALAQLDAQYWLAGVGVLLIAVALGYVVAGRALSPVRKVTGLARRVTQERLDERIAMTGPRDELRDLADTLDGMLDRLAAAFDGQRRFVANASHELRTPLTVIRAEVEVALADPDASAPELRQMGEVVLEAADRTQLLLDSLMVLARSQQVLPRREPVDLAHAARTAAALCEPRRRPATSTSGSTSSPRRSRATRRSSSAWSPTSSRTRCATTSAAAACASPRAPASCGWRTPARRSPPRTCGGWPSRSSASAATPTAPAPVSAYRSCARWPTPTAPSCALQPRAAGGLTPRCGSLTARRRAARRRGSARPGPP